MSTALQDLSAALAALAAKEAPSVVSVRSHRSRASGFVWRPGLIVTAEEALAEEGEIEVTLPGGEQVAAQLVGRDPSTDVALLRAGPRAELPVVLVPTVPPAGALAMAVGAEEGAPTAGFGVVSRATGPWLSLRGGEIDARIELDLRLRRSAEGGLALDAAGQAFGMTVFGPRRRTLVIPAATIERVAQKLEAHGRVARGYLGLGLQPVAVAGAESRGAMVMSVDPQGPGAQAGIQQGDVVVAWDGAPIKHLRAVLRALGPDSVGRTVTLRLRRGGDERDVALAIGERPDA
jgi:S1-C subfamily serine protease